MITKSSYLRFLQLVELVDGLRPRSQLDKFEEHLLNHIALSAAQGRDLLVKDLICLQKIGSLATLHNRIKSLVASGYIRLVTDDVDIRKKHVVITAKTNKYFEKLSLVIDKKKLVF
jgi:DNA-binding MarR family transcriptional regulator